MGFYTFGQNNSWGNFLHDELKGIGCNVIIEADNSEDAKGKALSIGIYFDGVEEGIDCECCGDRWYDDSYTFSDVPTIYGQNVSEGIYYEDFLIFPNAEFSYIHFKDGSIKQVAHIKKTK